MKHLNIRIIGQVQGVTFRYSAMEEANKLNIKGFVKNLSDGSVYIEAEGKEKTLEKFLQWCHDGPNFAKVEKVEVDEADLKNFSDFTIL